VKAMDRTTFFGLTHFGFQGLRPLLLIIDRFKDARSLPAMRANPAPPGSWILTPGSSP
jgi:hypothetical protein